MAVPNLSTSLPFQSLAAGGNALAGLGGDPQAALGQLGQNYNQQYQAALGMNQALFGGVQTGFEALRSGVDQQYQGILDGYSALYGDVLGRIAGTNETNLTDINTQYNAQAGAAAQNAVSRGLGNSTVQANMQRAIGLDRARAITDSQNRFAQLGANYASQLGQARLGAMQNSASMNAGLGQAQLAALERVNAPYPDAGMYASLAQMYGNQADRGRQTSPMMMSDTRAVSGRPGSPSPWGSRDPTGGAYSTMAPGGFFGGGGSFSFGNSGGFGGYGVGGYGGYGGYDPVTDPWDSYSDSQYYGGDSVFTPDAGAGYQDLADWGYLPSDVGVMGWEDDPNAGYDFGNVDYLSGWAD